VRDFGRARARSPALPRWILAIAAAALLVLAAAAMGAGRTPGQYDPSADREAEPAQDRARADSERRRSPEAQAERAQSRHRYGSATNERALEIAKDTFPSALTTDVWQAVKLGAGERIRKRLGRYALQVDRPGASADAIAESTVPLAVEDEAGRLAPVELALEDRGASLASRNPIVPVTYFKDARRGFEFGRSGIRVHLAGAPGPGTSPLENVASKAFFSNVATDTDFWITPQPSGAQVQWQLRSQASPERLALSLELPPGGRLSLTPDGHVDLLRDEVRVGMISPPAAVDADGQQVPVHYEVSGSDLRVEVAHRDRDILYPIMVDPEFYDWVGGYWQGTPTFSGAGPWQAQNYGPYYMFPGGPNDVGGAGLYILGGAVPITNGQWAEWYLDPWRAHITAPRAEFQTSQRSQYTCTYTGLWTNPRQVRQTNCYWYDGLWHVACLAAGCDWNTVAEADRDFARATFGYYKLGTGTPCCTHWTVLRRSVVFYFDYYGPTVDIPDYGTRPWRTQDSLTLSGSVNDWGIGLAEEHVTSPGAPVGANVYDWSSSCLGTRASPCPESHPFPGGSLALNTATAGGFGRTSAGGYREGPIPIDVNVAEQIGRTSSKRVATFRIDRSAPQAQVSGSLASARNGTVSSDSTLSVSATDAYSGVASISVKVNGQPTASASNPSPCDGCGRSLPPWTFEINRWGEGPHTISVAVTDHAGNVWSDEWSVTVLRKDMGQERDSSGLDWYDIDARQDIEVNVANGNAELRSRDLDFAQNEIDLPFERHLNTLWLGHFGTFGARSTASIGTDLTLTGSASQQNLSFGEGSWVPFEKQSDGSWTGPSDVPMQLTENADGSWDVAHDDSALTYHFSGGRLRTITDVDGASVSLTYRSNGTLDRVSDGSTGTTTTFTQNTSGDTTQIQQGSRSYRYDYGGPGGRYLLTFTDSANTVTRYAYDASNRLVRVTPPDGTYWQLSYDSLNRVIRLQHVTDATLSTGPTTTYSYGQGSTTVTEPSGQQITYQYDSEGRVTGTSASPLPSDYQTCLDEMQSAGADAADSEPVDDQLYCQTQDRDAPVTVVDEPVYDPLPVEDTVASYDLCDAEDGLAQCGPEAAEVQTPGPIFIGGTPQPPGSVPDFGIADNELNPAIYDPSNGPSPGIFDDPHFNRLNVRRVRVNVQYDLMTDTKPQNRFNPTSHYTDFVNWYRAARRHHLNIMVSFHRSSRHPNRIPSSREYQRLTRRFMNRFPGINTYSGWNEPNHASQPLHYPTRRYRKRKRRGGPATAALFTFLIRRQCRPSQYDCLTVAADFADRTTGGTTRNYERDYLAALRNRLASAGLSMPIVWAMHAYNDVREMRAPDSSRTAAFMDEAPFASRIWLNESGAFHRRASGEPSADYSQSRRVAYLVDQLAGQLPVSRLYYYYFWSHDTRGDTNWPTGLMTPGPDDGGVSPTTARPAYYQYQCRTNPDAGECPAYGQPNTANP
jgi:YD repeat-containing protein